MTAAVNKQTGDFNDAVNKLYDEINHLQALASRADHLQTRPTSRPSTRSAPTSATSAACRKLVDQTCTCDTQPLST